MTSSENDNFQQTQLAKLPLEMIPLKNTSLDRNSSHHSLEIKKVIGILKSRCSAIQHYSQYSADGSEPSFSLSNSDALSSLLLANRYKNVYDLDVITDENNIKRLLSLPYNSMEKVSMLIHRIGNTFLIDDLNLPSDLSSILRQGLLENSEKDNSRVNEDSNQKNQLTFNRLLNCSTKSTIESQLVETDNDPDDKFSKSLPKRPVAWNFDAIKFLIGSSLPVFSNPEHPTVSIFPSDVREPITVLTALDCWLDNLICSVPELAICFHLDGAVQRYDLIRTDEIPNMKGSEFFPGQIKTVASRLLKFLQENATKQGHTYWLYKCPDSDKVRIFDLTAEYFNHKNPITKSIVALMKRVAGELIHSKEGRTKYPKTIKSLISTCLSMIDKDHDPETFCDMSFMMSHLLINDHENRIDASAKITSPMVLREEFPLCFPIKN
ncbi:hypothetical protein GJ496_000977 [Pomphorhynchus laevis]|nr:hypothetical protein GJ496_000977 [Pomphorhynchus laevis]